MRNVTLFVFVNASTFYKTTTKLDKIENQIKVILIETISFRRMHDLSLKQNVQNMHESEASTCSQINENVLLELCWQCLCFTFCRPMPLPLFGNNSLRSDQSPVLATFQLNST